MDIRAIGQKIQKLRNCPAYEIAPVYLTIIKKDCVHSTLWGSLRLAPIIQYFGYCYNIIVPFVQLVVPHSAIATDLTQLWVDIRRKSVSKCVSEI